MSKRSDSRSVDDILSSVESTADERTVDDILNFTDSSSDTDADQRSVDDILNFTGADIDQRTVDDILSFRAFEDSSPASDTGNSTDDSTTETKAADKPGQSASAAEAAAGSKAVAEPKSESSPEPATVAVAEEESEPADRKQPTTAFDNLGKIGYLLNALVDAFRGVDSSAGSGDSTPDAIQGYTEQGANSSSAGGTWYQTEDSEDGYQVYPHSGKYPGGYYNIDPEGTLYRHGASGTTYQSH